jgi:DNA-binding MarR family transcriptional regulator
MEWNAKPSRTSSSPIGVITTIWLDRWHGQVLPDRLGSAVALSGRRNNKWKHLVDTMREPKTVVDFVTYRVLRLSNTFGLYASRRYRDQYGMTLPEWRVMSIVASCQPTTAREISRVLVTDKGWVGLSLEKLQRRGFIMRSVDPHDARRTPVSLTRKGQEMHNAILAIARRRQRRLLASLPKDAAETLIACFDTLQAEADRMLEELDASSVKALSGKARTKR